MTHCCKKGLPICGVAALLVGAALAVLGLSPALAGDAPPAAGPLQQMSSALEALTDRASPAVVEILVNGYGRVDEDSDDPNVPIGRVSSEGSGVIVDPDGYIVTNYHVVEGEQSVQVVLTPATTSGSQAPAQLRTPPRILPAKVVGVSRHADLAVLKVQAAGLPTIPFANYRKLRQGQLVLALGSPIGLKNSVSLGIVSSVLRQEDPQSPMVYIQTDAAINPGNSGGALIDTDGKLVGINSSILTQSGGNEGIGFAIPSGIVQFVYHQIRKYGHVRNGYIGASVQPVTPELASALGLPATAESGVIVSDVIPGGPAAAAGLHVYDRITSIDGSPVDSVPTFAMNIYLRRNGDRIRLGILRGSDTLSITVPVEEATPQPEHLIDLANPANDAVPQLGIIGLTLTPEAVEFLPPPRIASGVVVAATLTGRRAARVGLQVGDILHALNGKPLSSLQALRSAIAALQPGAPGALLVERDERLTLITFEAD